MRKATVRKATMGKAGTTAGTMLHLLFLVVLAGVILLGTAGCGGSGAGEEHGDEHADHEDAQGAEHDDHGDEHGDEHGHDEHGGGLEALELSPEAVERIGVELHTVGRERLTEERVTTGTLGFDEEALAHVGSRVPGRLVRVPGELGEDIEPGETLAVVDSVELGEAKAAYLRSKARAEVAERRYERERSLRADRIASEQDLLDAEAAFRETSADRAAAREKLRLLGLSGGEIDRLAWGESSSAWVSIRAPFRGRIVSKEAVRGELVREDDVLFTVADLSEVWLWVDLYERDLAHVSRGESVTVELDARPGEELTGRLAYIADQLDTESRTARARVDLPNPDGRLKPGMFARVRLRDDTGSPGVEVPAVPRTAVQQVGGASVVFVREAPGRFEPRRVRLGRTAGPWVEILDGVEVGEEIVTEGAFLLRSQASADQLGGHSH